MGETGRKTGKQADTQIGVGTSCLADSPSDIKADRQIRGERDETDGQAGKQADRQIGRDR